MAEKARGVHLAILVVLTSLCVVFGLVVLRAQGLLPEWLVAVTELVTSCPYRQISGKPCPFCGLSTSVALLVSGHYAEAQQVHPLAALVFLLMVSQMIYSGYRCYRPLFSWREEIVLVGVTLVVAAGIMLS